MADDTQDPGTNDVSPNELSRRDFVGLSLAAGLAAATGASAQGLPVTETSVEVKTPDGTCDAAFIHPTNGSHAAVLIWPDAFGLRPAMRDMGKRIAAEGYSVLVPNPFYPGLLHGRPAGLQNRSGRARPRRRRRVVPRRRARHGESDQPPHAHPEDEGTPLRGRRVERRCAAAGRERPAARGLRRRQGAGGSRGIPGPATAGACPTCRRKPESRSTTRRTPSARGPSSSRCTRPLWPDSTN